jgi:uncharacterized protein (DUF1330 family)
MPKAYWIAHVTVTDPEQYKLYAAATAGPFKKFGAVMLARGGAHHQLEGSGKARNVVIEFPSLKAALDCYNSKEYQAAKALRAHAGVADVLLVEGVEGAGQGTFHRGPAMLGGSS